MRLQLSLKKLATDSQASSLRLFGKIRGTERDYFIVEAVVEGEEETKDPENEEEEEVEPNVEEHGSGVNKFSYYVTTDIVSGSWTRLPDLKPS